MKRIGIGIGMAALILSAVGTNGDDWTTWRGPNGSGISAEKDWNPKAISKLNIKWEASLGDGHSAVAVEGEYLYTMGNDGNNDIIYCLHVKTGKVKWKHSYKCKAGNYKGPRSTPVIHDKVIFTVSRNGNVLCLDKKNGRVKWSTDLSKMGDNAPKWGHASSAVVYKDMILLGAGKAGIALKIKTGKKAWGIGGTGNYASVTLTTQKGQDIALIYGKDALYGVDPTTGKQLWSYPRQNKYNCNAADAVQLGDDKIFLSSTYKVGCAVLDISSGKPEKVWENQYLGAHFGTPILMDGCLLGFSGHANKAKELICVNAKNGKVEWKESLGYSSLSAADDKLLLFSEQGSTGTLRVAKVSRSGYKEIAAKPTKLKKPCWTSPVLSNGTIYCRDSKGTLLAIDVSK